MVTTKKQYNTPKARSIVLEAGGFVARSQEDMKLTKDEGKIVTTSAWDEWGGSNGREGKEAWE